MIYLGLVILVISLNLAAWNSRSFCDWYIAKAFPVWVNTYGRITGIFPFSVGEIMIILGVALLVTALVLGVLWIGALVGDKRSLRKKKISKFCGGFFRFFAWTLLIVSLVMTLNCFILYHGSTFSEKYFAGEEHYDPQKRYSLEELTVLRNYVVKQCNELCVQMPRGEDGEVQYAGDLAREAKIAMQRLGERYGNLSGYYPSPKPLICSDFMSQQYMAGYYFPFSMEANYNDVMYILNMPSTFCHELAHLRGYIYEDEANFIAYLACIGSEDPVFRYAGCLSVLNYVNNDFYDAIGKDTERYWSEVHILPQVHEDNIFLTEEEWDRVEKKAVLDTETVDAVSDSFTDATLKLNGVSDGMISYSRVVKLLLQYYDIYGYPPGW